MLGRGISNWVFVTGAPRSGTTFVGSMLSVPFSVDYIHEPFNPDCGLPSIDQRYLYLRDNDPRLSRYLPDIEALFEYRARLRTAYYPRDSVLKRAIKSVAGSRGPFYYRLAKLNLLRRAAVIKDPIGCFLGAFLQERFGVRPVLLIRHPVTFVASVMRLGWNMTPAPLLEQEELVEDYLANDESGLRSVGDDPIVAAAWIWRSLNTVLLEQARHRSGWIIVRHEDLSNAPTEQFLSLYSQLDLPWSNRVERRVSRLTGAGNVVEADDGRVQQFRRDSRKLHALRIAMLKPEDRRRVFEITGQVAGEWYDERSFEI